MLKDKPIDISTTNLALFGTPLEKEIKLRAAQGEPAWHTAGKKVGVEGWRVEQFQIVVWPKERFGELFDGDSFIFLNTYEVDKVLHWNVHFWLGQYTTQDEAGTAAYKTVELDDFLGGSPVQFREVQGSESNAFLSLFPNGIKILKGGVATGFKHVGETEFPPRLLHVKGKMNKTVCRNVPVTADSLNEGDCFILDLGKVVYQFNGSSAGIGEKAQVAKLTRSIDDERGSKITIHVVNSHDADDAFWAALGGKKPIKSAAQGGDDADTGAKKQMFRLSDASGKLEFKAVDAKKSSLHTSDVFIYDCIGVIWVWVGKGASSDERKNGLSYAARYLNGLPDRPKSTQICRVVEGAENEEFEASF